MPMFIDSTKDTTKLHLIVSASLAGCLLRGIAYEGDAIVKSLHRNGYEASEENLKKVSEIIEEFGEFKEEF